MPPPAGCASASFPMNSSETSIPPGPDAVIVLGRGGTGAASRQSLIELADALRQTLEPACKVVTSFVDKADRKSTRLNSSHLVISYAVFCLKKKTRSERPRRGDPDGLLGALAGAVAIGA